MYGVQWLAKKMISCCGILWILLLVKQLSPLCTGVDNSRLHPHLITTYYSPVRNFRDRWQAEAYWTLNLLIYLGLMVGIWASLRLDFATFFNILLYFHVYMSILCLFLWLISQSKSVIGKMCSLLQNQYTPLFVLSLYAILPVDFFSFAVEYMQSPNENQSITADRSF